MTHCFVFSDGHGIIQEVTGPASYEECCDLLIARIRKESDAGDFDEAAVRKAGNFVFPDKCRFSVCLIDSFEKPSKLLHIRICLGTDGSVRYWPQYEGNEDLGPEPLDPEDAIHAMTGGGVPVELACNDPADKQTHNYETLFHNPNGMTSSTVKLTRI